jgi:hypothetical protein
MRRALRRFGRWLEPLLAPDAEDQRARQERVAEQSRELQRAVKVLAADVTAQRADVRKLIDAGKDDSLEIQSRLGELRAGIRRQESALRRLARRAGIEAELELTEQRVIERLERLRRGTQPIVVGPWTGEIGFELLYWAPFVRWAAEKFNLPAERLVIVSRGGTASWYGIAGARYVDVFSLKSPDEFRARTEAIKKQRTVSAFDRDVLRRVRAGVGGAASQVLHPALMYALFMPFWKDRAPLSRVLDHVRYERIQAPPVSVAQLPPRYVAARFYFSRCFPDTPENRAFVGRVVETIAERHDIVMLSPGFRADDHEDYAAAVRQRVHAIDLAGNPSDNLARQTAIIAGADAFVGTYGGFAYLAPFCGVRATAFYSDRNYFTYHLGVAQRAFADLGSDALEAIDVRTVGVLDTLLSGVP